MELELKVGLFVTIGVMLIMTAVIVLGGSSNLFELRSRYTALFTTVDGLLPGAKVMIGGVQVGTVDKIHLNTEKKSIEVQFGIVRSYASWVRANTFAEVATQGVLGDKYVQLNAGDFSEPELKTGSEIQTKVGGGFAQVLSKSDQLLISLNSVAAGLDRMLKTFETGGRSELFFKGIALTSQNLAVFTDRLNKGLEGGHLKDTLKNLHGIMEKINSGTGTLGALVNDPGLYDDAKALVGGANRNRIIRNLVRQTVKKNEEDKADEKKNDVEKVKK
jgi:phospholipid/cholesterol/gamma-HCH transport system substrate-binding protein